MTDINEDYLFKVDLPGPDSIHAHLHAIAYVRRDEVLALFEEEYDNTFGPHILQTFYPEPLPLKSHKTVVDYSKYLMEVLGRSHITVRVPLGDQVADILHKSRDFQQSLSVCFTQYPASVWELTIISKKMWKSEGSRML